MRRQNWHLYDERRRWNIMVFKSMLSLKELRCVGAEFHTFKIHEVSACLECFQANRGAPTDTSKFLPL